MEELSVKLGLDIVYVSGKVNGIDNEFSLGENGAWITVADKAEDGIYKLEILAYNSLGTYTQYNTTLYKKLDLIPLKLDWTQFDYYNAKDINRVELNTLFISGLLEEMGYIANLEEIKGDWNVPDFPTRNAVNKIEMNLNKLKECFYAPEGWENSKTWIGNMKFGYLDALRYEKNLKLLADTIDIIKNDMKFSGTFSAGQEVIL